MTPHGSSTSSTSRIPVTPNPYEELGAPGDGPAAGPNPYDALAAGPGPDDHGAGRRSSPGASGDARGGAAPAGEDGYSYDDNPLGHALRSDYDEPGHEDSMPYLRAVRRRRRSRTKILVKLGVAFLVLLAFLTVGDRWAVLFAENKAAEQIQKSAKLHAEPEVHIGGFPFLTQVAAKRLDDVDVAIPDMPAGRISLAQVKGNVQDVKIVGDGPTSIKGAVLGRMKGNVLLDYGDLSRELGTSQVNFNPGKGNNVMAEGKLPVAGNEVKARARAHLRRTSDHGVATTVDEMRLDVPKLFSYTPGKNGGLRLARPVAERIQKDAAKAKALFRVGAVAERFGLTPERAAQVRQSESELRRVTGQPKFLDRMMQVNMLDVVQEHPELLKKIGIDPSLITGLKNLEEPKLEDKLSLNINLPELPGDVSLRRVSVEKDGIRAQLTGTGVPVGGAANK